MTVTHGIEGQLITETRNCIYRDIKDLNYLTETAYRTVTQEERLVSMFHARMQPSTRTVPPVC